MEFRRTSGVCRFVEPGGDLGVVCSDHGEGVTCERAPRDGTDRTPDCTSARTVQYCAGSTSTATWAWFLAEQHAPWRAHRCRSVRCSDSSRTDTGSPQRDRWPRSRGHSRWCDGLVGSLPAVLRAPWDAGSPHGGQDRREPGEVGEVDRRHACIADRAGGSAAADDAPSGGVEAGGEFDDPVLSYTDSSAVGMTATLRDGLWRLAVFDKVYGSTQRAVPSVTHTGRQTWI